MKFKKIGILVLFAIYVITTLHLMIYFVPYEEAIVYLSKQNVLHREVIGNGYASIYEISDSETKVGNGSGIRSKTVDTPQLITNIVLSTIIAGATYFLFIFKKEKKSISVNEQEFKKYLPNIDFDELAFADDKLKERVQKEYVEAVDRYVKNSK